MKTQNEILNEMLFNIPDNLDKREGSLIYTALAPVAAQLSEIMFYGEQVADSTMADTATGLCLTKVCGEFGVNRLPATAAIRMGIFKPATVVVGSRFGAGGIGYVVREALSGGSWRMECETTGTAGNNYFGAILPLDNRNPGLESAILSDVLVYGSDAEGDEPLRRRFYSEARYPEHGWNKQGYIKEIKKIAGVGDVAVFPTPNGHGGRITCIIVDPLYQPASEVLIDTVQTLLDPEPRGEGNGLVPPGHTVTVSTVTKKSINISTSIAIKPNFTIASLKPLIEAALTQYLQSVSFVDTVVRLSRIETTILSISGVVDIVNTKINGHTANVILSATADNYEVPTLGAVILEAASNV